MKSQTLLIRQLTLGQNEVDLPLHQRINQQLRKCNQFVKVLM